MGSDNDDEVSDMWAVGERCYYYSRNNDRWFKTRISKKGVGKKSRETYVVVAVRSGGWLHECDDRLHWLDPTDPDGSENGSDVDFSDESVSSVSASDSDSD